MKPGVGSREREVGKSSYADFSQRRAFAPLSPLTANRSPLTSSRLHCHSHFPLPISYSPLFK